MLRLRSTFPRLSMLSNHFVFEKVLNESLLQLETALATSSMARPSNANYTPLSPLGLKRGSATSPHGVAGAAAVLRPNAMGTPV